MASAAYGERVAVGLGAAVDVAAETRAPRALIDASLVALLSLEPGSDAQAKDLALRAWKKAPDDATRSLALALTATAMVYDPAVDGYTERLTDAAGLAVYAGTVDSGDPVAQALRGVVAAAAGQVRQARTLIEFVEGQPMRTDDTKMALTLARDAVRIRNDAFFVDAAAALTARPDAHRLRALLAERYLDLGLDGPCLATLAKKTQPAPLGLLAARALLERRDAKSAGLQFAALVDALAGVDEPRRAEAVFGLAAARVDDVLRSDADVAAIKEAAAALAARPGWKKESAYLDAMHGLLTNKDAAAAQAALAPLAQGTASTSLEAERRITRALLDVCAQTRDTACLERAARRLDTLDVDPAAAAKAFAAAANADATNPDAAARAARRALALAPADESVAQQLRAARRAIAAAAPKLVRPLLDDLVKQPELRVARALRVLVATDPVETARFAAAAVTGSGPALDTADLLVVVDGLGAFKNKETEAALRLVIAELGRTPNDDVAKAVELTQGDWKNPDQRKRRKAGDHADHTDHGEDH